MKGSFAQSPVWAEVFTGVEHLIFVIRFTQTTLGLISVGFFCFSTEHG